MARGLLLFILLFGCATSVAQAQTACGGLLQPACPAPAPPPPAVTPAPEPDPVPEPSPTPSPEPEGPSVRELDRAARTQAKTVSRDTRRTFKQQLRRLRSEVSSSPGPPALLRLLRRALVRVGRLAGRSADRVGRIRGGSARARGGLRDLERYYRLQRRAAVVSADALSPATLRNPPAGVEARVDRLERRSDRARRRAARRLGVRLPSIAP